MLTYAQHVAAGMHIRAEIYFMLGQEQARTVQLKRKDAQRRSLSNSNAESAVHCTLYSVTHASVILLMVQACLCGLHRNVATPQAAATD